MDVLAAPASWLLAYLHALPAVALTADASARPHPARSLTALLRGQAPAQLQECDRWFTRLYALSAAFLATATASSALRHDPWAFTAGYTTLTVLTAFGAHAWNTALGKPPATQNPTAPDATEDPDDSSDGTPPNTPPR